MLQIMLLFFNHLIVNKTFFSINPFFLFLHGFLVFKLNSYIKPEELQKRIEQHFSENGLAVELKEDIVIRNISRNEYHKVKYECKYIFNRKRELDIEVYFNGQYEPIITGFNGIFPINEMIKILTEFKAVIENL